MVPWLIGVEAVTLVLLLFVSRGLVFLFLLLATASLLSSTRRRSSDSGLS